MKIKVYFLLKSREIQPKKVNPKTDETDFRKGMYFLAPEAINFYRAGDYVKGTECFFFEGNSSPINIKGETKDASLDYLDRLIYEGVLEQTGALRSENLKNSFSWMQENITIGGIVKWGLAILIVGSALKGWLGI